MEKRQRSTTDRLSERSIAHRQRVAAHAHSSHDAFRRAEAEMPRPRLATASVSSLICRCISSIPSLFRLDQGDDAWASEMAGSACANPKMPFRLLCLARVDVPDGDDQRRLVRHFPGLLDDHSGYLRSSSNGGGRASQRLIMAPAYAVAVVRCTRCK